VDALAGWGVPLANDPERTDMELTTDRRHHVAARAAFDDPVATAPQRELFRIVAGLPTLADAFVPPELPHPSPLSDEIIESAAQLRSARIEGRRAREELRKLKGSRRRLLSQIVQTVTHRTKQ
jgi:hypothetical protein